MKRIVRLTESDLSRIIKRIVFENDEKKDDELDLKKMELELKKKKEELELKKNKGELELKKNKEKKLQHIEMENELDGVECDMDLVLEFEDYLEDNFISIDDINIIKKYVIDIIKTC